MSMGLFFITVLQESESKRTLLVNLMAVHLYEVPAEDSTAIRGYHTTVVGCVCTGFDICSPSLPSILHSFVGDGCCYWMAIRGHIFCLSCLGVLCCTTLMMMMLGILDIG